MSLSNSKVLICWWIQHASCSADVSLEINRTTSDWSYLQYKVHVVYFTENEGMDAEKQKEYTSTPTRLLEDFVPIPLSTNKGMCLCVEYKLVQRNDFWRTEQQVQILECFGK